MMSAKTRTQPTPSIGATDGENQEKTKKARVGKDHAPARRRSGLLARTTLEGTRRPRVEGASVGAVGAAGR